MNGKTVYLSKKGIKELKRTISQLKRDQQRILQQIRALDKVDHKDERLARVEKLAELESTSSALIDNELLLQNAKQFPRKRDALVVALGSVVDMIDTQGRMIRYTLVDSIEANPSDGRISIKSPLGQHLLGKTVNDIVQWGSGMKLNKVQLVNIA